MEIGMKDHQVLISSVIRVLQDQDIKDPQDREIKVHQVKDPCLSLKVTIREDM